jgi:hypothetical protein
MYKLVYHLILCFVLFSLVACGGNPPPVTSTASPMLAVFPTAYPAPTIVPMGFTTSTAVLVNFPLFQSVTLTSYTFSSVNSPDYTMTVQTSALNGSNDPRVIKFNHEMYALVQGVINEFDVNQKDLPADPTLAKSFLDVRFELVSPPGNIFSLKFSIMVYVKGAAHPYDYTRAVTYDLEKGEDVTLARLFLRSVDYLGTISEYCLDQLKASEIGSVLSTEGVQPTLENYRNWNISAVGLVITFDEYQVAAYAAGPQIVTVPYFVLASIIDPQGPLAAFLP